MDSPAPVAAAVSSLHLLLVPTGVGLGICLALGLLYVHFFWRNGKNRLPDRPHSSNAARFWNELGGPTTRQQGGGISAPFGVAATAVAGQSPETENLLRHSRRRGGEEETESGEDSLWLGINWLVDSVFLFILWFPIYNRCCHSPFPFYIQLENYHIFGRIYRV